MKLSCFSILLDSVHDESYGKRHGQDMKAALYLCNPELSVNASQAEMSQPIVSCLLYILMFLVLARFD